MDQAKCRSLVQSLAERQELAEFEERAAKSRERKARQYAGALQPGTLTKTVARRVAGRWEDWEKVAVAECGGRV